MKNNEKFLKKITSLKETISYEKALYLNALYKKSPYPLSKNFLPTGWHWIYFNENYKLKDISTDGHLKRGKILPAFKGYKRMYAGGKLDFKKKIRFGEILEKISFAIKGRSEHSINISWDTLPIGNISRITWIYGFGKFVISEKKSM